MSQEEFPEIACVIIGINVSRYLADCITSIRNADYPQEKLSIIYSDGGSSDTSPEIARSFPGVRIVELKDPSPTPGKGRNAGYRATDKPYIMFLDGDTLVDKEWFKNALPNFKDTVVAVTGKLTERWPDKNLYHVIASIEWQYEEGVCRYFGGNFMIKKSVLDEVGCFDPELVAGEDPDLSYRVRQKGYTIYRISQQMVLHDLNMTRFRQYLKRSFRGGYAYTEIALRYMKEPEKLWLRQLIRIIVRATLPFALIILGALVGFPLIGLFLALALALKPLLQTPRFARNFKISFPIALLYALHISFVVFPQMWGVLRYGYTLVGGDPLRNKGYRGPANAA
jgi:GT2 family glycosyltransferase